MQADPQDWPTHSLERGSALKTARGAVNTASGASLARSSSIPRAVYSEQVSDNFILDVWQVMRETPHHNYQILTKRPERMADLVASKIGEVLLTWLRTSIENAAVVERIEHLRKAPAAIDSYPSSL